jgi:hypothetical protein
MAFCKKHKKPKDQLVTEIQEHGGTLRYAGCIDCKLEAAARPRPSKQQTRVKSFVRRWF